MTQRELKRFVRKQNVELAITELKRNGSELRLIQLLRILSYRHGVNCDVAFSDHGKALYWDLRKDPRVNTWLDGKKRYFKA